jgi:adenosylcobinamide-phosphate synthase
VTGAAIMVVALVIDAVIGWPKPVHAVIGHPVTWIGRLIDAVDGWLNLDGTPDRDRRFAGIVAALLVIFAAAGAGLIATWLLPQGVAGALLGGILAWPLLAARSLHDHVADVARPLVQGDLAQARAAVARIVGREPDSLDAAGVARASLESLAENTSDGVIAPLFWGVRWPIIESSVLIAL